MRMASLIDINADTLFYSSVAESTENEYDSGTSYSTGAVVKVSYESDGTTPRRPIVEYESLEDSNSGNYPPDNPSKWFAVGATNRWAMFDPYINTQTEDSNPIEFEVETSGQNTITLLNLDARAVELTFIVDKELLSDVDLTSDILTKSSGWSYDSTDDEYDCDGAQTESSKLYVSKAVKSAIYYQVEFTVANYVTGSVAGYAGQAGAYVSANGTYTQVIAGGDENKMGVIANADFEGSITRLSIKKVPKHETISLEYYGVMFNPSYYEYFFGSINYIKDLIWQYPYYPNAKLRCTIEPIAGTSTKCGAVHIGNGSEIAKTQYEPIIEVLDWSKFAEDSTGRVYYKKGNNAKRIEMQCWLETKNIDAVRRVLESYVGAPIVLDGNNAQSNFSSLIAFGILRDNSVAISGPVMSRLDVEMRGFV